MQDGLGHVLGELVRLSPAPVERTAGAIAVEACARPIRMARRRCAA